MLASQLAALEAEFLLLVAELDTRGLWGRAGLRSAAHWLSWRLGLRLGSARERVRVGHALNRLPAIAAAFGDGQLSYCKVRALTRVATPATEAELLEIGLGTTGAQCETVVRAWRTALTAEMSASSQLRRTFRRRTEADGAVVYTLRVAPDDAAVVDAAMGLAQRTVLDDDGQPIETPEETALAAELTADPPTVRAEADAFLLLAESFVAANGPTGDRGDGLEVVLYAELTDLLADRGRPRPEAEPTEAAPTEARWHEAGEGSTSGRAPVRSPSGQPLLSATALRRLCESSVRVFLTDPDGRPLDLGRQRRHASRKQRRALHIRDRGCCRQPGCTQRKRLIPHHVDWWSRGGPTDLDNLVLFCPSHHRAVHEVGYTVVALGGGRFRFYTPDGREIPEHPDRQPVVRPVPASAMAGTGAHLGRRAPRPRPPDRRHGREPSQRRRHPTSRHPRCGSAPEPPGRRRLAGHGARHCPRRCPRRGRMTGRPASAERRGRLAASGDMRIATWNVNSITARLPRLLEWLEATAPDAVALQETKIADAAFPTAEVEALGYQVAAHGDGRWNGVALLSKVGLDDVARGLQDEPGFPAVEARAVGGDLRRRTAVVGVRAQRPRARPRALRLQARLAGCAPHHAGRRPADVARTSP